MDLMTELAPVLATRAARPPKALLPYSSDLEKPLRHGVDFPPAFVPTMNALTDKHWKILTPDDLGLDELLFGVSPFYNVTFDTLNMLPAEQFSDDSAAWHALFHESAHRFYYKRYHAASESPSTGHDLKLRGRSEIVADLASWLARLRAGIVVDTPIVRAYVADWMQYYPRIEPRDFALVDSIAHDMVQSYKVAS